MVAQGVSYLPAEKLTHLACPVSVYVWRVMFDGPPPANPAYLWRTAARQLGAHIGLRKHWKGHCLRGLMSPSVYTPDVTTGPRQ